MRCIQPRGLKGSLHHIQSLVSENPTLMSNAVRAVANLPPEWQATWVSPLRSDQWAEYRDSDYLAVTGLGHLARELEAFWPKGGPQWDALAKTSDGGVVLIEAKSHFAELASSCQAQGESLGTITDALSQAKAYVGASPEADWLNGYYQYANRLAHLYFLGHHHVPAYLVLV